MKNEIGKSALALIAAIIWGLAFVAQSESANKIGFFTFNAIRCIFAFITLLIVVCIITIINKKKKKEMKLINKSVIVGGTICGILLFIATNLQQYGITHTSAGKAGFITSLYIVIVPILGIFRHKKLTFNIIISVLLALIGLYFLCISDEFYISRYDLMIMACAFIFSFHIISVDYFSSKVDCIMLSLIQFFVSGVLSTLFATTCESIEFSNIKACIWPLLYVGILSSAVAYTLQIIAQKGSNPTTISIILSLESVFSVIGGLVILHNLLTLREYFGCALMFIAVIFAQVQIRFKTNKKASPTDDA